MRLTLLLLLLSANAYAQRTYTISGNFATDILGEKDERPGTWGRAGASIHILTFRDVPDGNCVRLKRIVGDFVLWPTTLGATPAVVPEGRFMGGLAGIQRTPRDFNADYADWAAGDTWVYVQAASSGDPARVSFDADLDGVENAVVGRNHQIAFVQAVWLNDTGLAAHMEITFSSLQFGYAECPE